MYKIWSYLLLLIVLQVNGIIAQDEEKPNVIFILADDLGYAEVGAFGQEKIETPNIDALAKDGMKFTQFYSGAPVCAPARAILLSGQHAGHAFIRGNHEWGSRGDVWDHKAMLADSSLEGQHPIPAETILIPELLKEQGYATGMIGKWGLGAPHSESVPNSQGFDYFFGYNCQRIAHTLTPTHMWENNQKYHLDNDTLPPRTGLDIGANPKDRTSYEKYDQKDYAPTVSFEKLMDFVKVNKENPFFLYWATPIPHVPLQAPRNWIDYYVKKFGEEDPYYFYENENGSYFPARYPRATYAAMVSYLDENIGKLVQYLKDENLYDNTLIIFTSDNGPTYTGGSDSEFFDSAKPFSSENGRGKGYVYEGGIRVPMVATWPDRIPANTESNLIATFYDVMPTLSEITGSKVSPNADGTSFAPTLTMRGEQVIPEYHYWEFAGYNGQIAVRMGDWKFVWKDIQKGNKEVELYNLVKDVKERNNIADQHPDLVSKFFEIVKKEHITAEVERFKMDAVDNL
ncbi:arylsulfatase [Portibacter marinus]|uniref:arylsulfatase n=1 Tax=Portibacter marinus TaxID=2898660 RepID=UPI001F1A770D|nr:arylsulfatase [Portibacter marinus]